ncbi:MAG: efflux RND transporter periplasmic adaptor subunit [Planctomycetes bacterium]|nr:efflux RND transporter periplasmic adaptor subunit [Planctomycetota bacterium]
MLFSSCNPKPLEGERAAPAGDHPEKSAQVTVWGDRFEAFIEHRPIIAAAPATLVTHLTDLQTLEPRRAGPVKFLLRSAAGASIEHVEPAPARAGIYTPALTIPQPGQWTARLAISTGEGDSIVDLPAFAVFASKDEAVEAPDPEAPEGISFLKEQQWKVKTKAEPVGRRHLVERRRLPGVVSPRPSSKAAVTPPVAGRLLAPPSNSLPSLGDRVAAGQTLALVQPPFSEFTVKLVESEAEVIRAKLARDLAELAFARAQKLAAGKFKSERELQEADFALRTAQANHQAALAVQAAYRKAGAIFVSPSAAADQAASLPAVELKSPISGAVVEVAAAAGEHVPSDRAVFRILDTASVLIEAKISESDLNRIEPSQEAFYETPDAQGKFVPILGESGGRVAFFGPAVDPASRTVPLVYEMKNPQGRLRIDMTLTLYLATSRAENTLAIPESAIVDEEGRPTAFVQRSGETFEKRYLTLGIRDGGFVQVLSGLSEGERVVTKEGYAIRLASVSTSIPAHGHAH